MNVVPRVPPVGMPMNLFLRRVPAAEIGKDSFRSVRRFDENVAARNASVRGGRA
jgi:hypothetical protein